MSTIFLDRDGVVTPKLPKHAYLLREDQAVLDEGVVSALRRLSDAGHEFFVISNQRCVALGLISLEEAHRLMGLVLAALEREGVRVRDYRLCPHDNHEGCACRKPKPGMILDLAATHGADLGSSIVIGDAESDVESGKAAGCGHLYLIDGQKYRTLAEVADEILRP